MTHTASDLAFITHPYVVTMAVNMALAKPFTFTHLPPRIWKKREFRFAFLKDAIAFADQQRARHAREVREVTVWLHAAGNVQRMAA